MKPHPTAGQEFRLFAWNLAGTLASVKAGRRGRGATVKR
jgi:hypothetical protein